MMDFSMRIMLALLLTHLQLVGGDFSPSVERAESSKSHHQRHRRGQVPSKPAEIKKENDDNVVQSATDLNSNLEWVTSAEVPKDAVSVKYKTKEHYIAKYQAQCVICLFDKDEKSCANWWPKEQKKGSVLRYDAIMFLVNKDNFEMMEWKKCTNQNIPPMSVEICDGHFIAKNEGGFIDMTIEKVTVTTEVLTLNNDYKMQHMNIVEYLMSSVVTAENLEVLKHFQASNKNCEPSKHTVKFDQNIDKTTSYQTGRTHTFGANAEISVGGKIISMANIGGKFGLKYDYSRARSNTTSVVEKTLHSVGIEVEIPPNHSCTIDITSNTFMAEVPFTGEMTRMYRNNEIRKTFINGTYIHQEVAEIQTLVNPCQPLFDRIC